MHEHRPTTGRLRRRASALALALLPALGAPSAQDAAFDHEHSAWTRILAQHVKADGFDYGALRKDRAAFDAYLATLAAVTPRELERWTKEERFAFWINVYNAFTVEKVVDEYPLKSIRDLDGLFGLSSVFDKEWIPMRAHHPEGAKDDLSPNDVEHGILRKRFGDARLHAAVNCASESCPPLRNEAFVAARLDEQLTEQMTRFLLDETRNELRLDRKNLRLSEIFKWFAEDFERDAGSVNGFVARFLPAEDRAAALASKVTFLDYDWSLNDSK